MNGSNKRQQELFWLVAKIASVAILGGAIYVLGRLYLEAYYFYFGIAPGALSFSTEDYMFSCLNVGLMVAGIVLWTWLASKEVMQCKLSFSFDSKRWQDLLRPGLTLGLYTVVVVFILTALFEGELTAWLVLRFEGWLGLLAGLAIGMVLFYLCNITEHLCRHLKTSWRLQRLFKPLGVMTLAVFLLASLPYLSGKLAQSAAFVEFQEFPQVTIVSDALPLELQTKTEAGDTHRVTGKLLVINNGMAYVFKSDVNESSKALVESPKSGKVYAIRFSDIKYMVQYPVNTSDNSTGKIRK